MKLREIIELVILRKMIPINEFGAGGQKLWPTKDRYFCVHSSVKIYGDFDHNI